MNRKKEEKVQQKCNKHMKKGSTRIKVLLLNAVCHPKAGELLWKMQLPQTWPDIQQPQELFASLGTRSKQSSEAAPVLYICLSASLAVTPPGLCTRQQPAK